MKAGSRGDWAVLGAAVLGMVLALGFLPKERLTASPPPPPSRDAGSQGAPAPVVIGALENVMRIGARLYCGAEPKGAPDFASLAKQGIRTLVSVDGAIPDVEGARAHGLRYLHIPMGYDGVEVHAGASLARIAKEIRGPLFIHCHHGRHRGPAAAAMVGLASGVLEPKAAEQLLVTAGTSPAYQGLWQAVADYEAPGPDVPLPELVETAEVSDLTERMVSIDRIYERLRDLEAAEWETPEDQPDLEPVHQALLLLEGLRESGRHLPGDATLALQKDFSSAEQEAGELKQALEKGERARAKAQLAIIGKSCRRCHRAHRDPHP